jgi:hypothetical protein
LDFLVDVLDADVFDVLALFVFLAFVFLAFFAMAHLLRDVIGRQRGEKTRGSFSAQTLCESEPCKALVACLPA